MIKLVNFTKSYSSLKYSFCVDKVSFEIPSGHIAALLGPNGSGKTTIIKALTANHYADSGEVLIDEINAFKNPELVMEKTGYVPEISTLPSDLYVGEFLLYCAEIHGLKDKKAAVNSVVKKCSLQKVLNKKIKQLSKGYQQRVSFAQAIIHNPPNLILDEPVSGLDPSQILQMRSLIKDLSKDKAILMSTHLLQEVYSLCTEIYIMNNGKLAAGGTEQDILSETGCRNLEEAFVKLTKEEDNNE